ncbi:hypothetical protein [Pseudoalteromonas umbrosa]|uniref:hypothetical protein n=1 Tax=Pseudoalteromonas umbrosa TaxID=3048489 RepID=UPI0024C36F7D|nr:hypothetical protein [Pseudoalteromonas sp. B95]MDK1286244.1 hypothetical protein [Pseudoalteromonas sp. B95]
MMKSKVLHIYRCLLLASSLFLLLLSVVPGAMSVLAFYASLIVLLLSIMTIQGNVYWCFKLVSITVGLGMLLVNDYLRLFAGLPSESLLGKLVMYSGFVTIVLFGIKRVLSMRINSA